jgi:hypothetical protein
VPYPPVNSNKGIPVLIKVIHCRAFFGIGLYINGGQMLNFIWAAMHDLILNVNLREIKEREYRRSGVAGGNPCREGSQTVKSGTESQSELLCFLTKSVT